VVICIIAVCISAHNEKEQRKQAFIIMEHEQKFKEYDFEPLGLPEQDGVWQVWGDN
jgi:hypothetical protein